MNLTKKRRLASGLLAIIVAYLLFMGATLGFVFFTFGVEWDLVTDNYYQKTLTHQGSDAGREQRIVPAGALTMGAA